MADVRYLHAITNGTTALPPDLTGFAGAPLSSLNWHDLCAVTSSFDPATLHDFTLEDVLRHHALIEALAAKGPVLPVRFATVFLDETAVRQAVVKHYEALMAELARLGGKIEMGVSVLWNQAWQSDSDAAGISADSVTEVTGPGVFYIKARMAKYKQEALAISRARSVARALHNVLRPSALESRYAILPRSWVLLRASYLLERSQVEAFNRAFTLVRDQAPTLRMLPGGPWPPYSFFTQLDGLKLGRIPQLTTSRFLGSDSLEE